jgi:Ran GTPase-activating protein (RanGAP) involved in mRNA processing and transport
MNQPGVEKKKDASLDQDLKVIIAPKQRRFDKATDELKNEFKDVDLSKLESLTLSGNSYGLEACKWIGENVLSKAKNLKYAIFSDLFVSRLRAELPESLLYLMDNIMDKNII